MCSNAVAVWVGIDGLVVATYGGAFGRARSAHRAGQVAVLRRRECGAGTRNSVLLIISKPWICVSSIVCIAQLAERGANNA